MRCPNCGSSAQPKILETEYHEDGWSIEVIRTYKCGCGCIFTGTSYYISQEQYEIIEKVPDHLLSNY